MREQQSIRTPLFIKQIGKLLIEGFERGEMLE